MTSTELALSGVVALLSGGGIWSWLSSRGKEKVDLITLGQSIAAATIAGLRDDRAELLARIDELEEKIDLMAAHIDNLENTIRAMGAQVPPRPHKRKVGE